MGAENEEEEAFSMRETCTGRSSSEVVLRVQEKGSLDTDRLRERNGSNGTRARGENVFNEMRIEAIVAEVRRRKTRGKEEKQS